MKTIESKIILDSSAWLAYFLAENQEVKDLVEQELFIFTATISIFEIKRKLVRDSYSSLQIEKTITFIKNRSIFVELTLELIEEAASISVEKNLAAIDALVYTSARKNNALLVTGDNDFRQLEQVKIIE